MSEFKTFLKATYSRVGIILCCFILSSLLLNCKIISQKEDKDKKRNTENLYNYVFNNSFKITIPNYLKLDSDISNYELIKHDKTNNTYYYKLDNEDNFVAFINDTIDAKIGIVWYDMSDASNELKKDSHYSNMFANLAFNKEIFENRFEDNIDDIENFLNYQYMDVGNSKAFHINYDKKVGLSTYEINHIYNLWNYDERVSVILNYYSNINKNIKDECESIINSFKWLNPK